MLGLLILGLIDIIAGIFLILNVSAGVAFTLGIIMALKGLWSIIASAAAGFYFEFPGIFDFIGGIFLFLVSQGVFFEFFLYIGLLLLLKGIYSLIISMISH